MLPRSQSPCSEGPFFTRPVGPGEDPVGEGARQHRAPAEAFVHLRCSSLDVCSSRCRLYPVSLGAGGQHKGGVNINRMERRVLSSVFVVSTSLRRVFLS